MERSTTFQSFHNLSINLSIILKKLKKALFSQGITSNSKLIQFLREVIPYLIVFMEGRTSQDKSSDKFTCEVSSHEVRTDAEGIEFVVNDFFFFFEIFL